jgi:hypothetical protein
MSLQKAGDGLQLRVGQNLRQAKKIQKASPIFEREYFINLRTSTNAKHCDF